MSIMWQRMGVSCELIGIFLWVMAIRINPATSLVTLYSRSVRADDVFLHLKTDLPNKSAWRGPVSGIP
jgi:hypothetical protein